MEASKLVVFFDGDCALCNRQVQLLLRLDKRQRIAFAPLQGNAAKPIWAMRPDLQPEPGEAYTTMLAVRDLDSESPQIWLRSDAALQIARELGGPFKLLGLLGFIPRPLRNAVYNVVARNRYRWFGRARECIWDPQADPARFLS